MEPWRPGCVLQSMRILSARSLPVLVALLLLTALAVSGFVAGPVGAQEASPAASPSASAPADVEVDNADSGRTVSLVTGQHLRVRLVAPQGEQWQGPATTQGLYLLDYRENERETTARLHALRAGTFELRARTDRRCFHTGEPCPQAFSEWSLQVVVEPGPAPDTAYDCVPEPRPSAGPNQVFLGRNDDRRRVTVPLGHRVQVYLGRCEDQENPFTLVTADRPDAPLFREGAILRVLGGNSTSLTAVATGTATISAETDPPCLHTANPCARPTLRWSVEVEVVPPGIPDERCLGQTELSLEHDTVTATGSAVVRVHSSPRAEVELWAYTRPSTTFRLVRSAVTDDRGVAAFTVRPPGNTRLYARKPGCEPSPSQVLNVSTALTLTAQRTGPREYVFAGDSLPARPGGLVVSLYRVTADGRQVLTAQTRADSATGEWRLVRRFTGTGRFGFVVRTGQDLQNAPGSSNVRSLLVF